MDCYIINIEAVDFMVSGICFSCFILVISYIETNDPHGVTNLNPRDMVGTIYVGDHQTLL